jgi:hypothetical protein
MRQMQAKLDVQPKFGERIIRGLLGLFTNHRHSIRSRLAGVYAISFPLFPKECSKQALITRWYFEGSRRGLCSLLRFLKFLPSFRNVDEFRLSLRRKLSVSLLFVTLLKFQ